MGDENENVPLNSMGTAAEQEARNAAREQLAQAQASLARAKATARQAGLPTSSGEEPTSVPWWKDLSREKAREAIWRGEGLNLASIPGTGKSTLAKDLIRESGDKVRLLLGAT